MMKSFFSLTILFSILLFTTIVSSINNFCPKDMVPVPLPGKRICIDRFEWPNKYGQKPLLGLSGVREPYEEDQITNIEELCQSVGKRVCTAEEWVAACSGPDHQKYPFGDKLPKYTPGEYTGLCNYDKKYRPVNEHKVFLRDPEEMQRLDQSEPAGSRKSCRSPTGAWDMMGNAEEWVKCKHGVEGWCLASRFWAEPRSCQALVRSHSPRWHYYGVGGRCCF